MKKIIFQAKRYEKNFRKYKKERPGSNTPCAAAKEISPSSSRRLQKVTQLTAACDKPAGKERQNKTPLCASESIKNARRFDMIYVIFICLPQTWVIKMTKNKLWANNL